MAGKANPSPRYRVTSIVGTRAEAIKMAPVVRALCDRPNIEQCVLLTGQHHGLAGSFERLPAKLCGLDVDPRDRSFEELRDSIKAGILAHLAVEPADLVIVQGDTTSALAGALAARERGIAVAHVEAGLRSFDPTQPWPEENNRVAIDAVATLLFAPTDAAAANLVAEPAVTGSIYVTGNSGIDALLHACAAMPDEPPAKGRKTIVVTCHRKENQGADMRRICDGLIRLVEELPVQIVFPLHPNRHLRLCITRLLERKPHIKLVEALDHQSMVRLMRRSWLILTDSGGIQEEAPALGTPAFVLRDVTERGEAVGNIRLIGTDPDAIFAEVNHMLMDEVHYARMARPALPFGDGHAAPRMAAHIEDWLTGRRLSRRFESAPPTASRSARTHSNRRGLS